MHRSTVVLSFAVLFLGLCVRGLAGQEISREQFRADFNKGVELGDERLSDRAMKRGPTHAALYYEELFWEKDAGRADAAAKCQALQASWRRCFDGSDTLEHLDRWCSGATNALRGQLQRSRDQTYKLWNHYSNEIAKEGSKADHEQAVQQMMDLARHAESFGHAIEASEIWSLAAVIAAKMPDKTLANRRDAVFASEQFLAARKQWNFTFDEHYIRTSEFVKAERLRIQAGEQEDEKRKSAGYAADAKGIDALVMPNAVEARHGLKFEALPGWDELDYGSKGGPLPAFWWLVSTQAPGSASRLAWFRGRELYLHRLGAAKFALGADPTDPKGAVEVDVSPKGKVSTFWLDPDKKRPYAMVFWIGSEREMVNEAECNLAPGDQVANVYYRSASSWKTQIGGDTLTLYDDSADGQPGEASPFGREFRTPVLGAHDLDQDKQTLAPLLDSMRIGKGPRVPFSEFVKLSSGWMFVRKSPNSDEVGVRPLNPEFFKTGRIKLVWNGPKQGAPVQLVVQGQGDYQTALFDVAGGKEVEVPAAEYRVIWGRIMVGKGPRAQVASLYGGDTQPFTVEPGKVFELKMGAPFALEWQRRGDENVSIDALKIRLVEASGCALAELHGISLACDVMAAKEADGKGAKPVGRFVRFTDPELVNEAAKRHNNIGTAVASFPMPEGYRSGDLALQVKLPAAGMKLALVMKKHPLFGDVKAVWH
jgi:hypothetical protein